MHALRPASAAIVDLSAAIAAGSAEDVSVTAELALDAGAGAPAVYEAVLQSYLFLGFPRAIEAFFAARRALDRRPGAGSSRLPAPGPDPASWRPAGEALCRRVYGRNYEKLLATMEQLSPDLASAMILDGYGKTLSRPGLDVVDREYAVVAILTVTRMWRQLRSHAIGAVNVGGTRTGVREAIERCRRWTEGTTVDEALRTAGLDANARR
jgi:alkylhydroperoxidase/carboxymuconolactone decarboxylase family protein YurZ